MAQDALRGKLLYHDVGRLTGAGISCVDCHGAVPGALHGLGKVAGNPAAVAYALGAIAPMEPLRGKLTDADMADLAAYVATPTVPSPELRVTAFGPAASPYERLEFTAAGISSVRLTNAGRAGLLLAAPPVLTGADRDDFQLLTTDCRPGLLGPGESCEIELRFVPRAAGLRSAAVRIAHDWIGGGTAVALIGRAATAVIKP